MNNKLLNAIPDMTVLLSALLAVVLNMLFPSPVVVTPPFTAIGWALALGGFIIAVRMLALLRAGGGSSDVTGRSAAFVATGPYRISRNPFYLCYVVTVLGVAIGLGSLAAFAAPLACFCVLNFVIIPLEERNLHRQFGDRYATYMRTVRRWL